jgi:hypothetical protein
MLDIDLRKFLIKHSKLHDKNSAMHKKIQKYK